MSIVRWLTTRLYTLTITAERNFYLIFPGNHHTWSLINEHAMIIPMLWVFAGSPDFGPWIGSFMYHIIHTDVSRIWMVSYKNDYFSGVMNILLIFALTVQLIARECQLFQTRHWPHLLGYRPCTISENGVAEKTLYRQQLNFDQGVRFDAGTNTVFGNVEFE